MNQYTDDLIELLNKSLTRIAKDDNKIALSYSGGLDSSVLAWLLKDKCDLELYTVGIEGSHDFFAASNAANTLNIKLTMKVVTDHDVEIGIKKVKDILKVSDPVRIAIELPLYFVAKDCSERIIITGQGADELFGGYNRYLEMNDEMLKKALETDLKNLLETFIGYDMKIASSFDKEIRFPFLDDDIRKFALTLPTNLKVSEGDRKIILRKAAKQIGLPEHIANSKKKAAQYGSGIMNSMKRLARADKTNIKSYIEKIQ